MSRIKANVLGAHDLGDHCVLGLHHSLSEVGPDSALHPLIGQLLSCGDLVQLAGEEREFLSPRAGGHTGKLISRQVGLSDALEQFTSRLRLVAFILSDSGVDKPLETGARGRRASLSLHFQEVIQHTLAGQLHLRPDVGRDHLHHACLSLRGRSGQVHYSFDGGQLFTDHAAHLGVGRLHQASEVNLSGRRRCDLLWSELRSLEAATDYVLGEFQGGRRVVQEPVTDRAPVSVLR